MTVSEWAKKYVYLPGTVTARAGYWRPELTPYAPEVMDTWALSHVRKIVFAAGPQTGKTLTTYIPILYAMDRQPGPVFMVMAGQDGARKISADYIQPILKASPLLRSLLSPNPDDLASYRLKFANGMRLYTAWVSSDLLLKTFPARYGHGDEVDDWHKQGGKTDDPEGLFDVRLRSYPNVSKLTLVSTPGEYDRGIWPKLLGCQEARVWMAACPSCGVHQRLVWPPKGEPYFPRVIWPKELTEPGEIEGANAACYLCAGCGAEWDNRTRNRAVTAGGYQRIDHKYLTPTHWHDPFPQPPAVVHMKPVSVGFHVSAICSPFVSLSKSAAQFVEANREPDPVARRLKLRTWRNNYPSLPWLDELQASAGQVSVLGLRDDRPAGVVSSAAMLLILTADVQQTGIWYELRAWAEHHTSWLVRYGFLARAIITATAAENAELIAGDFASLEVIMAETYSDSDGQEYPVWFGLVDARYRTDEVYDLCRRVRNVHPAMGYETKKTPITYVTVDTYAGNGKRLPGGLLRADLHSNYFKTELSRRLQGTMGDPGSWNLNASADAIYAQHYSAEAIDDATGLWARRGNQPNHLWDCGYMQLAAVKILEDQRVFQRLTTTAPAAPRPKPTGDGPSLFRPKQKLW